jgi:hypothetical protein
MAIKQTLKSNDVDEKATSAQVLVECGSYVWALGDKQLSVWDAGGHLRLTSFSCLGAAVISVCRVWCSAQQKWTIW